MNPYEVLEVDRNANEKEIKKARKRLTRKWHSDLFHTEAEIEKAKIKMQEINEAFEILINPQKRHAFDLENPDSANVYEYYAKKESDSKTRKKEGSSSADIENEKQRRAVVQFLEVEYKHKAEILEAFAELATGAVSDTFSDEEYIEYLEILLAEQEDCVAKLQEIVRVAKAKKLVGLEANFKQAQDAIEELKRKRKETPKSLKQAHYAEETRILTEKINVLMSGFAKRLTSLSNFDLLYKTWEFKDDRELNSARKSHKNKAKKLLADVQWVEKTASERNITIGLIDFSRFEDWVGKEKLTLKDFKEETERSMKILTLKLSELRKKFWDEMCKYGKNAENETIFCDLQSCVREWVKGDFICPPHVKGIANDAFYWLQKIHSIQISANLVNSYQSIDLPSGPLKQLVFDFGTHMQIVDISNIDAKKVTKKGEYICIKGEYSYEQAFALVDENGVYVYDNERLYELNGVTNQEELESIDNLWKSHVAWPGYEVQIHTWAQVVKRLPNPNLMKLLPVSIDYIKEWIKMDKTNFEIALSSCDNSLKPRIIRLYIALGALNGKYWHERAEWMISRLDVSKMYRSRLERVPKEKNANQDPMFSVPNSAVELVQENINNEEFLPYVFAFLEGYNLFQSEANKANVVLSPEFIIQTAPQYIFHKKVNGSAKFVSGLLQIEKDLDVRISYKILSLYNLVERQRQQCTQKNIIETVDTISDAEMHYRFFNLKALETYLTFEQEFKLDERYQSNNRFYSVEAENVFASNNSHAIEIIDGENKSIAIAILNLFDEGELFADVMSCENKSIEVLETIKRALQEQRRCNDKVTGISIGMNEAPRTTKYNKWHEVLEESNVDWTKQIEWIKFEYCFECRMLGISYKGYRTRFMIEGERQYFDEPNPWDNPKISRRRNRRYYGW